MSASARTFAVCVLMMAAPTAFTQDSNQGKGAELLSRDEYRRIAVAPISVSGTLPNSATLENSFPTARAQGKQDSCTAWATSYNKAYRLYMADGRRHPPDSYLQSPAFVYSATTNGSCRKGTPIPLALRFLKAVGSVAWEELPYNEYECGDWSAVKTDAKNNSFTSYRLTDDPDKLIAQIRNKIIAEDPVIAAIYACPEFKQPSGGIISGASADSNACDPHAVLIVGYDDDLKAVRLLNSWGDKWGDNGKAWMSYSVLKERLAEAYVDLGPGTDYESKAPWEGGASLLAGARSTPTITPELLVAALRSNIDPKVLRTFHDEGGEENVGLWSIWLSLPEEYRSQIRSVGYSFNHPTFRHNPQRAILGSTVFLSQWRGYGCVNSASVEAQLVSGATVRADFNFCDVVSKQSSSTVPAP